MKKIKIVYCLPSLHLIGGMERVLTTKANYLADKMNYEIYIILTDGNGEKPYFDISPKIQIINLNINFELLYTFGLFKGVFQYLHKQYLYRKKLTKALLKIRPDITISMLRREINFINSIKDGSLKIGEIHFSRNNYRQLKGRSILKKNISKIWMKSLITQLKKLNQFIVLSQKDKENWTELNNVSVIYNPLSFYPETSSNVQNKVVVAAGRHSYEKGFDLLVDAWEFVHEAHPDWHLKIYGAGNADGLKQKIDELNLGGSCQVLPPAEDISNKFIESSIFVLSSRIEGFGLVLIEAMSCGLPPISFDCPFGPREIIKDGEDGFLVDNGNIKALADKINFLIENEAIRKKIGQKARINVERFKIETIMAQWNALFNSLLENKVQKR
jgi:glycosyltransferase involved in cell wall biosynthesis